MVSCVATEKNVPSKNRIIYRFDGSCYYGRAAIHIAARQLEGYYGRHWLENQPIWEEYSHAPYWRRAGILDKILAVFPHRQYGEIQVFCERAGLSERHSLYLQALRQGGVKRAVPRPLREVARAAQAAAVAAVGEVAANVRYPWRVVAENAPPVPRPRRAAPPAAAQPPAAAPELVRIGIFR